MKLKHTIRSLFAVIFLFGFSQLALAQPSIDDISATLSQSDNGYVSIGDEITFTVTITDPTDDTEVTVSSVSNIFGQGNTTLTRDGDEFSGTVTILASTEAGVDAFDGEDPENVTFTINLNDPVGNSDETVGFDEIDGVTELVDNVVPVFDVGASSITSAEFETTVGVTNYLFVGNEFDIALTATDGSGNDEITIVADLTPFVHNNEVTIEYDEDDSEYQFSGEVLAAETNEQLVRAAQVDITLTLTDAAGNSTQATFNTNNSNVHLDNLVVPEPTVVAVPRGSTEDNFIIDIVATPGSAPRLANGDLFTWQGTPQTYTQLIQGYRVEVLDEDENVISTQLLGTAAGQLATIQISKEDFDAGDEFDFVVNARKTTSNVLSDSNEGDVSVVEDVEEISVNSPANDFVVGNTPLSRFEVETENNTSHQLTSLNLVRRAVDDALTSQATIDVNTLTSNPITADALRGGTNIAADATEFEYYLAPQFQVNGINLSNITDIHINNSLTTQAMKNTWPVTATVVDVPRGRLGTNADGDFVVDFAISNGDAPLDTDGQTFGQSFGDIVENYSLTITRNDNDVVGPTVFAQNNDGNFQRVTIDADQYLAGHEFEYALVPLAANNVPGDTLTGTFEIADQVQEISYNAPEEGFIVGNTSTTALELSFNNETDWEISQKRLYQRAAGNTAIGITLGGVETGDNTTFTAKRANQFNQSGENEVYGFITFQINGVELSGNLNQDRQLSINNNGVQTVEVDNEDPTVELLRVDGQTRTTGDRFNVDASGETTFQYRVTDNYDLDPATATGEVELTDDNDNVVFTLGPNTVQEHIDNEVLEVDGNLFTLTLDISDFTSFAAATDKRMKIKFTVNDGRGNEGESDVNESVFTVETDFEPSFILTQPVAGTQFRDELNYRAVPTEPGSSSAILSGYIVQFSTTADFEDSFNVKTETTNDPNIQGTVDFTDLPINFITLEDAETYYVRMIIQGSADTTATVPVVYNSSGPMVDLEIEDAIEFNGQTRVRGQVDVDIVSDDQLESVSVRARRTDNTFPAGGIFNVSTEGFTINTNLPNLAQNDERTIIIEVVSEDPQGNETTQYFTIVGDNKAPDFRITSINGSTDLSNLGSMFAGEDLVMELEVISPDFSGEADFTLDYDVDGTNRTVVGVKEVDDKDITVTFTTLPSTSTESIDLQPGNDFTASIFDLLENSNATYVGPTVGSIEIVGSEEPAAILTNVREGFSLNGTASGITYRTVGQLDGNVLLEIRRAGSNTWVQVGSNDPDTAPNEFNFNTTNQTDDTYEIRVVAQNGDEQYPSEPFEIVIDNTNDGDTERATIVDLDGARLGGEEITLVAEAGENVGAVEFRARFMSAGGAFTAIGETINKNADGNFILRITPDELRDELGLGNISDLDGEHEIKAVGSDLAGHEFEKAKGNTPNFATGNADNENEVASTFVNFDFTAPTGRVVFNGSDVNTSNWNGQNAQNFNMFSGDVVIGSELIDGEDDFDQVRVTIQRQRSVAPGTGTGAFQGRDEVTIGTLSDLSDLNYTLDTSTLFRSGLYRVRVYISDDLGNESNPADVYFVVGAPQVRIAGFNPVKQELYLLAPAFAQSASVEYSTGGAFTRAGTYDLGGAVGGAGYDQARTVSIKLGDLDLPDGEVTFRVIGSERQSNNFSESRFASAPATLTVSNASAEMASIADGSSMPVTFLENSWTPGGTSGIALALNKDAGDLQNIRVEVMPSNPSDDVSLFFVRDNNPNNADAGNISTAFFKGNVQNNNPGAGFLNNGLLQSVDGQHYAVLDNNGNLMELDLRQGQSLDIAGGGVLHVFATTVSADGTTDMTVETIRVHRVAANRGGEIRSVSGDVSLAIEQNTLNGNAGIYIEEDRARFRSTQSNQLDMGQLGPAYWISSPSGGTLRDGLRANVTMSYDPDELGDVPAERINVAFLTGTTFSFNTNIRDKNVDTENNTVSFEAANLNNNRYTLVADGVANNHSGSIEVVEFRVGSSTANNYATANSQIRAVVRDNLSGLNQNTALMYVNGTRINTSTTAVAGNSNTFAFQSNNIQQLDLAPGVHTARFVVENNSGDRLDTQTTFVVDNKGPVGVAESAIVGKGATVEFTLIDPAIADTLGAGVDMETVNVDVFQTSTNFYRRYTSSDLNFSGTLDTMVVSLTLPQDIPNANNFTFVVNSNSTPSNNVSQYGANQGPRDLAGNTSDPYVFNAGVDTQPPSIAEERLTIERGMEFTVDDDKSGIDVESIEVQQALSGSDETETFTWTENPDAFTYNEDTKRLVFSEGKVGAEITLIVADKVGNVATATFTAESEFLSVSDVFSYPNPLNPDEDDASIRFTLSRTANVSIELFDFMGRSVNRIARNESYPAGTHTVTSFAGQATDGQILANGVYFLQVTVREGGRSDEVVFKTVIAKE